MCESSAVRWGRRRSAIGRHVCGWFDTCSRDCSFDQKTFCLQYVSCSRAPWPDQNLLLCAIIIHTENYVRGCLIVYRRYAACLFVCVCVFCSVCWRVTVYRIASCIVLCASERWRENEPEGSFVSLGLAVRRSFVRKVIPRCLQPIFAYTNDAIIRVLSHYIHDLWLSRTTPNCSMT